MNNVCLFKYTDEDGDLSSGFTLKSPNGIDNYPDLIKHYSEFFKSEEFRNYIISEFNCIDCEISVGKYRIDINYTTKYDQYDICFCPFFVKSF